MSVQHFKSLLFKSAQIQEEIDKEHNRRSRDWMRLLRLKKLRLAIKDRLHRLAHGLAHDSAKGQQLQPVRIKSYLNN